MLYAGRMGGLCSGVWRKSTCKADQRHSKGTSTGCCTLQAALPPMLLSTSKGTGLGDTKLTLG